MTEEEKNAVEIVKGLAVYYDDYSLLDEEEIKENESVNKSIELILNLIEKLLKENEQLRTEMNSLQKENEELKNQEAAARKINELLVQRYSSSVPIQKIKDKIEELKNNIDYLKQFKDWYEKDYTNEDIINNILEVLQELLGGKEQNE